MLIVVVFHSEPSTEGVVDVSTLPVLDSIATQRDDEAQEMWERPPGDLSSVFAHVVVSIVGLVVVMMPVNSPPTQSVVDAQATLLMLVVSPLGGLYLVHCPASPCGVVE